MGRHIIDGLHQSPIVEISQIDGVDRHSEMSGQGGYQRGLSCSRRTMEKIAAMIWNAKALVSVPGLAKLLDVFQQVLFLAWLQDDGIQDARGITLHVIPTIVISVQIRLHTLPPDM